MQSYKLGTYYEIWYLNLANLIETLEKVRTVIFDFDVQGANKNIASKVVNGDFPNTSSMLYWVANEINHMFRHNGIRIRVVS